jgi:hypothetical protein
METNTFSYRKGLFIAHLCEIATKSRNESAAGALVTASDVKWQQKELRLRNPHEDTTETLYGFDPRDSGIFGITKGGLWLVGIRPLNNYIHCTCPNFQYSKKIAKRRWENKPIACKHGVSLALHLFNAIRHGTLKTENG